MARRAKKESTSRSSPKSLKRNGAQATLTQLGSQPTAQPSRRLETFANPNPGRDYLIHMEIPEFTCLCPVTGQPDFATLTLDMVPGKRCI
ncbi:MAG TPA: hypothetical protein VFV17_03790, partial [Usitatibacteraceae bacterium]|nr:hypothetical protein [Usitatibacteraceae bacterium]